MATDLRRKLDSQQIVEGCRRQERSAQAAFYQRYRQDVSRVLFRILGPDADLEDALQDVFVEAFRSIERFKGDAKITTWLYRVAVNVALQKLRRQRRRPEGHLRDIQTELPDHDTPLRVLQRRESARLIYQILDTIAPKKRTVFILHEMLGMSPKEISEVVRSKAITVRTRLHYARKEFYEKALETELARRDDE